jgi:hypothetical protein
MNIYKKRQMTFLATLIIIIAIMLGVNIPVTKKYIEADSTTVLDASSSKLAVNALRKLPIKGRAPKTNYSRDKFGSGWSTKSGCDTRNIILNRDLDKSIVDDSCNVTSGILEDPYTGETIVFKRGSGTSSRVQIDHVVALSDAWQKGAQLLSKGERTELANDPLELLAVDGPANMQKSDGDAATWLPSNKSFRCQYVARQIAVKQKYGLWVTNAEYVSMNKILVGCSNQLLPTKLD